MNIKKRKRVIIFSDVILLLVLLIIWIVWANTALEVNTFTVKSKDLPASFNGYRIAHISDLHNAEIGDENSKLLSAIKSSNPDIIAVTGDLIDSNKTDIEIALRFMAKAVEIAPCYYVTGNHESYMLEYKTLRNGLINSGVTVLENENISISKSEEAIELLGVNDPEFKTDYSLDNAATINNVLSDLKSDKESFTLLLSHRPELFDVYVNNDIDLILSGHAHGGQFRLPFVGGLVAPNQGVFPKYDAGLFSENETNMIVSKGIGNSIIPLRFNNRPELVLIELESLS
ncbi:MAG: metallophosphoesterase [Acutalibacteraceae bacterium]|nr:metallophosphoesterase [Acutalibacteraceae bacterium]